MITTQVQGAAAEDEAARYLAARGLQIIERNFRIRGGEIDLVCREGATVVFVEVRFRRRTDYGGAAASVTAKKQGRVVLAARHWLARHRQYANAPCRFDCVLMDGQGIDWLKNAFPAD